MNDSEGSPDDTPAVPGAVPPRPVDSPVDPSVGVSVDPDADPIENLDAVLDAEDGALTGSLRELLRPPLDIEDRVADTVSHRLRGRSVLGTAVDLLGLGARTVGLILSDDPSPADRNQGRSSGVHPVPTFNRPDRGSES